MTVAQREAGDTRAEAARGSLLVAAGILAGLAVLAAAACLLTIPFLGHAPGNRWAGAILHILAPGVLIPLALVLIAKVGGAAWIDDRGEWVAFSGAGTAVRLATSIPLVLVALAAVLAGLAPLAEFMPGTWYRSGDWVVGAFAALIGFAILISSVAGSAIMAGWKGVPAALLLTGSFASLTISWFARDDVWEIYAYGLLAAAVAWFYAIGAESGHLPAVHRLVLAHWLTGALGAGGMAAGLIFGMAFPAVLGLCVFAAWLALKLPASTRPAAPARRPGRAAAGGRLERSDAADRRAGRKRDRKRRSRQAGVRRRRG
jgi:hypothetical protein